MTVSFLVDDVELDGKHLTLTHKSGKKTRVPKSWIRYLAKTATGFTIVYEETIYSGEEALKEAPTLQATGLWRCVGLMPKRVWFVQHARFTRFSDGEIFTTHEEKRTSLTQDQLEASD